MTAGQCYLPSPIEELVAEQGLTVAGIAAAVAWEPGMRDYRCWLAKGHHGDMQYLERHATGKFAPQQILPGCRTVLTVALNYYQPLPKIPAVGYGRVARYAWGRDYHKILGKKLRQIIRQLQRLYPKEQFRLGVDAIPLAERHYASQAGIGFIGANTCLISPIYGSWMVIGEILTTRPLPIGIPASGGCRSDCRRCVAVCPTGALYAPYRLNASRCISYLTLEHRGAIPPELRPKIGLWLAGCDLCQEVCPHNSDKPLTSEPDLLNVRCGPLLALEPTLQIYNDQQYQQKYAGTPLMRMRRQRLVGNACIVAANTGSTFLTPLLQRLISDPNPVIAEHAGWALDQLARN